MLYNPMWALKEFIEWLKSKDADEAYDWSDGENCLMARYLRETERVECGMPDWYMPVTLPRPWTFGAALNRASER